MPDFPAERLLVELGGAGHVHGGNLDVADLPCTPFRLLFYHRDVPLLFPLPALIRSAPILPGRRGQGLGEKGHPRHGSRACRTRLGIRTGLGNQAGPGLGRRAMPVVDPPPRAAARRARHGDHVPCGRTALRLGREDLAGSSEPGLWVNLNRDEFRSFGDTGQVNRVPGAMIAGPASHASVIEFEAGHAHVSVTFALGAARCFVAPPMDLMRDDLVPLEELWGRSGGCLRERLLDARHPRMRSR